MQACEYWAEERVPWITYKYIIVLTSRMPTPTSADAEAAVICSRCPDIIQEASCVLAVFRRTPFIIVQTRTI